MFVERTLNLMTVQSPFQSVVQEVRGIIDSMPTQDGQPVATRDRYARNLLRALLPGGYIGTTPAAVHGLFVQLWERFDLVVPQTEVQS